MRPLRIVSVSIPYPGPRNPVGGLFVQRRLRALARLTDLRVLNPQPWFPWLRPAEPAAGTAAEQPPVERPRMFYLPGAFKSLDGYWLKRCLVRALRRIRHECGPIDLIDAHFEYPEAVGCVRAGQELGLPVFVTLRGLLTKYLATRARRGQCLWALHNAAGIISVAHALARTAGRAGIPEDKIRVIPNAVDAAMFHPGDRAESRAELGLPGGPLVVTVGHLQHVKGQHLLVPAFARVAARNPGARLALVGNADYDRAYTNEIRRLIREHRLEGAVTLVGRQAPGRVACWLRAADVFALPSYHEGCCNAVLEALACGAPVVTTPVGDNADFIEESGGGLLTPVGEVQPLADALDAALGRPWDRAAIAAYASARGWDRVAEETLDFFRERLGLAAPPAAAAACADTPGPSPVRLS